MEQLPKRRVTRRFAYILFALLFLIGALVRLIGLGAMPDGVNQDEAMAAYQAYTMVTEGLDLNGYHNPVYFEAWGSGMNALEIYLMMPMIRLFGMTDFTIRFPQALISILCMPVLFLLFRRMFDRKTAFIGLFLYAINPWSIMMSRWALESNLAPAFLLAGLYFFVLALEKHPAFYLLSALMYGLCLYTYAIVCLVVPVILLLQILYALIAKKARVTLYTAGFVVIVGLMAIPLLLLIAVNRCWIPEIKTAWFSVPHLASWRQRDLSLGNLTSLQSFSRLFELLVSQSDGTVYGSFDRFGLYYLFSMPLILLGLVATIRKCIAKFRSRTFSLEAFLLIQLLAAVLACLLLKGININRVNCIHIPMILFCAVGVRQLANLKWKVVVQTVVAAYCISFLAFTGYYFGEGQTVLSDQYRPGTKEAILYAKDLTTDTIVCRIHGTYAKVLYYLKMPLEQYHANIVYVDPTYPEPASFDQFAFENPQKMETGDPVYIIEDDFIASYEAAGYTVERFDRMAVAYLPDAVNGG